MDAARRGRPVCGLCGRAHARMRCAPVGKRAPGAHPRRDGRARARPRERRRATGRAGLRGRRARARLAAQPERARDAAGGCRLTAGRRARRAGHVRAPDGRVPRDEALRLSCPLAVFRRGRGALVQLERSRRAGGRGARVRGLVPDAPDRGRAADEPRRRPRERGRRGHRRPAARARCAPHPAQRVSQRLRGRRATAAHPRRTAVGRRFLARGRHARCRRGAAAALRAERPAVRDLRCRCARAAAPDEARERRGPGGREPRGGRRRKLGAEGLGDRRRQRRGGCRVREGAGGDRRARVPHPHAARGAVRGRAHAAAAVRRRAEDHDRRARRGAAPSVRDAGAEPRREQRDRARPAVLAAAGRGALAARPAAGAAGRGRLPRGARRGARRHGARLPAGRRVLPADPRGARSRRGARAVAHAREDDAAARRRARRRAAALPAAPRGRRGDGRRGAPVRVPVRVRAGRRGRSAQADLRRAGRHAVRPGRAPRTRQHRRGAERAEGGEPARADRRLQRPVRGRAPGGRRAGGRGRCGGSGGSGGSVGCRR
ncbi:hypothetical protein BUB20358_06789 [Burkholderia ubonensis]|nr:hypothetical protein BUB20358_06789 [Burkholderia ubonensis]